MTQRPGRQFRVERQRERRRPRGRGRPARRSAGRAFGQRRPGQRVQQRAGEDPLLGCRHVRPGAGCRRPDLRGSRRRSSVGRSAAARSIVRAQATSGSSAPTISCTGPWQGGKHLGERSPVAAQQRRLLACAGRPRIVVRPALPRPTRPRTAIVPAGQQPGAIARRSRRSGDRPASASARLGRSVACGRMLDPPEAVVGLVPGEIAVSRSR